MTRYNDRMFQKVDNYIVQQISLTRVRIRRVRQDI